MNNDRQNSEYISSVDKIVKGISLKFSYKFKYLDTDDIYQELWVKVLEVEKVKRSKLDLKLVAKICYDHVNDLIRKEMRKPRTVEISESFNEYGSNYYFNNDDSFLLRQFYDSLPKNSKESRYMEFWMSSSGFCDYGFRPDGKVNDGFTETYLSKEVLGFAGTGDRGYKNFKKYMRRKIKEFLDG